MEITKNDGKVVTWRIKSVNGKTMTLEPNGSETVAVGDKWQGVYHFETLRAVNGETIKSIDPIRIGLNGTVNLTGPTTAGQYLELADSIKATTVTVTGNVSLTSITADTLTIASGAILTVPANASTPNTLNLNVTGALTVQGSIDVGGRGYGNNQSYPDAVQPYAYVGGSHIGGGKWVGSGSTYGSVYRPMEAGGSAFAGDWGMGGGVVRIQSGQLVVDGSIRANAHDELSRTAAGGSIWITTGTIRGNGTIEANGGQSYYEAGGGGAIAVEYSDANSQLPGMTARGGNSYRSSGYGGPGGAGSVYVKKPGSTYGDLTIDNKGLTGQATELPSLGSGIVAGVQTSSSGVDVTTDRSTSIPQYFAGHWVEITKNDGKVVTWRIKSVNGKTMTLEPNGSETVAIGDKWRGGYRFDTVVVRNGATLATVDPILVNGNKAPIFNAALLSQIVVNTTLDGSSVTGPANCVTDVDLPIRLTITSSHGIAFTGTANGDGSFNIPVSGPIGETFSIVATDSNAFPASSLSTPVNGQIVVANPVTSVTVQPNQVAPGSTVTIAVRIYSAAPTGGIVVNLASSSAGLPLPATLTIPAGSSVASISVVAGSVPTTTAGTVSAQTSGAAQTATLMIVPSAANLASVSIAPASLTSGTSATGTVILGDTAPASGATVLLSSSNSALIAVPQSVTIAPGATSATFSVTALQTGTVDVIGLYGTTQKATVTITSCGTLPFVTPPSGPSMSAVWFDESPTPVGGTPVTSQAAAGATSILLTGAGKQQFTVSGFANNSVVSGESLIAYALINPCKPPREIQVIWKDSANTEYRASWGEDVIDATTSHLQVGPMVNGGAWVQLSALASALGTTGKTISSMTVQIYDGEAWFDLLGKSVCSIATPVAAPVLNAADSVWYDDAVPAAATIVPTDSWTSPFIWDSTQKASGTSSHTDGIRAAGHGHGIANSTPVSVHTGDVLVTYVLIDPCNPVREILLQWQDGSGNWGHRAYWGENLFPAWGANGTSGLYRIGPLPAAGGWVRLEVPVGLVGLNDTTIIGDWFGVFDGRAWFDHVAKISRVDLALNKVATQSTTLDPSTPASNAVDGNLVSANGLMAITTNQANPWWQVDLGSVQPIESVEIRGRTDCCPNQTSNLVVFVSDTPLLSTDIASARAEAGVSSYATTGSVGYALTLTVNRTGRYVRIWRTNWDYLTLPEVLVWAPANASRVNLAGGHTPTAGDYYLSYFPENAVNASTNDTYDTIGNIYHSATGNNAWWQVDLGQSVPVSSIDISSRTDGYPDQLTGFYVLTTDDANAFASNNADTILADPRVSVWYRPTFLPIASVTVNRNARYIRLQRPSSGQTNALVFTEVQVWSGNRPLMPLEKTPTPTESNSTSVIRLH